MRLRGRSDLALTMRRVAWWVLSPAAYATSVLATRTRCRVLIGPFRGMRYPFSLVARTRFDGALQLGSYECELHEAVEELVELDPGIVVNVGAGAGYYCVGIATRLPRARVIAYEAEAENRGACAALAERNGVRERLTLRGTCTRADFEGLVEEIRDERVAVILDCEGLEVELVDPDAAPWLREASLLAELHPSVDPTMAETLSGRLADTHEVSVIGSRERWASSFPEIWRMRGLRNVDRELLVAEHRHGLQQWLWARPRAAKQ